MWQVTLIYMQISLAGGPNRVNGFMLWQKVQFKKSAEVKF